MGLGKTAVGLGILIRLRVLSTIILMYFRFHFYHNVGFSSNKYSQTFVGLHDCLVTVFKVGSGEVAYNCQT